MDELELRSAEVTVNPEKAGAARELKPLYERVLFGRTIFLFDGAARRRLAELVEVRTPGIADLFVAVMGNQRPQSSQAQSKEGVAR